MKLAHIIKVQQNLYASFVDLFLQVTSVLNKKKFEKKNEKVFCSLTKCTDNFFSEQI